MKSVKGKVRDRIWDQVSFRNYSVIDIVVWDHIVKGILDPVRNRVKTNVQDQIEFDIWRRNWTHKNWTHKKEQSK